jgi:hypothetical protein
MANYLNTIKVSKRAIMEGSFIQTYLLVEPKMPFLYPNAEREGASEDIWESLPKIVWTYASKGIQNSGTVSKLLAGRM